MKIRTNSDIIGIMLHHTKDVETSSGISFNKDYSATPNFFGSPYDIYINRDGTIDLTPRWIFAVNKLQYLKNIPVIRILSHTKHFYAGIGETEDMRKDYVHVAVSGDFDSQELPKVQLYSLVLVINTLVKGLQIDPRVHLFYHGDQVVTSCPGFKFVAKNYLIDKTKDAFVVTSAITSAASVATPVQTLNFNVQPTNAEVDAIISPAIQVELLDAEGARITSFTGDITISIDNNPSAGTLSGTLIVSAINGVATFNDLSINVAGSSYTLRASSLGKVDAISTPFNITAPVLQFYSDMSIYDNAVAPSHWYSWSATSTLEARSWNVIGGSGSVGFFGGGATGIGENRKIILATDTNLSINDFYAWNTADDNTPIEFIDVDVITRLRVHTQFNSINLGLAVRATGSLGTDLTGYVVSMVPYYSGSIRIIKYVAGSGSILASTQMNIGRYAWYNLRLQALGDNIKAKFWDFDNEEPVAWELEVTDTPSLQNNKVGIYARGSQTYNMPIDVISLSADGVTSPISIPSQFDYVCDLRNEPTGPITGSGEWEIISSASEISASVRNVNTLPNPIASGASEAMQGQILLFYAPTTVYGGDITSIIKFKPSGDNFRDVSVLARVSQGGTSGVVGRTEGIIFRGSGSSGYVVDFLNTQAFEIGKLENGVHTVLDTILADNTGTNRYIRAKIEGDTIYGKTWVDDVTDEQTFPNNYGEPTAWTLTVVDSSITNSGYVGFKTNEKKNTGLNNPHFLDFMGVKILNNLGWKASSYDFGDLYGTGSVDINIPDFFNQKFNPSVQGVFSMISGSNIYSVTPPTTKTLLYNTSANIIGVTLGANHTGSLSGIIRGVVDGNNYDTNITAFRYASLITASIIAEVYAEDYGAGLPSNFTPTSGPDMTKIGTPGYGLRPTELGSRGIMDINSTNDGFNWDSALTTTKQNYAIFTVVRQSGTTSGGNIIDFRSVAGTEYKLILTGYNTNNTRNGWYYGQSGTLFDLSDIIGEEMNNFTIRCWLFEDDAARLFLGGGIAAKSGVFEDTALDTTLRMGFTASNSLDIEIAHVAIYSLPLGEKFTAKILDDIGNAIQDYYAGGALPEAIWNAIAI